MYIAGDDDDGDDNETANKRLSKESEGRIKCSKKINLCLTYFNYLLFSSYLCNQNYRCIFILIYI